MTRTLKILCTIVAALVFPSVAAHAVEDTTAPVLTDFTLTSSASIDTGPSSVSFAWTATATDDLSGVRDISVKIREGGRSTRGGKVFASSVGDLDFTDSGSTTLPRYLRYGTFIISVTVTDQVGNTVNYHPNGDADLCVVDTPCQIVNAAP